MTTTAKGFVLAALTLCVWTAVPRTAEGGAANDAPVRIEKGGGSCKSACFHAEATCRGKRGACMAARQRCVKGCR